MNALVCRDNILNSYLKILNNHQLKKYIHTLMKKPRMGQLTPQIHSQEFHFARGSFILEIIAMLAACLSVNEISKKVFKKSTSSFV